MSETATAAGAPQRAPRLDKRQVPRVIAVDGSAASGKSTVGRRLAAHLGYPFLDTGIMYRAFTHATLTRGIDPSDGDAVATLATDVRIDVGLTEPAHNQEATVWIDGKDVTPFLRRADVEEAVSLVSRIPAVREALVRQQREIAARKAIVMAGRDIGTVVLPDADLKLYLDASLEERARRRHLEFDSLGRSSHHDDVLEDLRRRDQIDSERQVSPLRPADDAVVIITDGLNLEQVLARVISIVEEGA